MRIINAAGEWTDSESCVAHVLTDMLIVVRESECKARFGLLGLRAAAILDDPRALCLEKGDGSHGVYLTLRSAQDRNRFLITIRNAIKMWEKIMYARNIKSK